jgi:hypothetical protein
MANIQPFIKFALLFSVLGIAVKICLWQLGVLIENPEYAGMSYLLFIMFTCLFSVYTIRRKALSKTKFVEDFKYGMKSVALTALIVSFFTLGFYEYLDPEYMPNRIAERVSNAEKNIDLARIMNPMKLTKIEMVQNEKKFAEMIFSPFSHSVISLFIFLILGALYSAIITFAVRRST